jgi:Arc/MetJ family transcription regulator
MAARRESLEGIAPLDSHVYDCTEHTHGGAVRTNIVIDDKLMDDAMQVSGKKTKRETVEEGLRLLVHVHRQNAVRRLRGRLKWEGDLDRMRRDA